METVRDASGHHTVSHKLKRLLARDSWWAVVFLLPSLAGFLVFIAYPLLSSVYLSFTEWGLSGDPTWVGLDNYVTIFTDATAQKVFGNTVVYTLVTVPVLIIIPLLLAVALNQKIRGVKLFRTLYFLPVVTSMVAISIVWQWMFNKDFGIVNYFLSLLGIGGPNWLTSKQWALPAIMITSVWKNIGYNMILFLAGLQSIPLMYYEAAELDGINRFQSFTRITVPLLNPTTLFVTIMTITNSFQVFDQVVVMTDGGPSRASSVLVHYIYQNAFKFYKMGYACALGWVLALFILLLTAIMFRFNQKFSID